MRATNPNRARQSGRLTELLDDSVYRRLRCQAKTILLRERPDRKMEPADLVHDAFVRIARSQAPLHFQNEGHLQALVTIVMRRILIDQARGPNLRLPLCWEPLDSCNTLSTVRDPDTERLRDALQQLEACETRLYQVVQMRFFWGFRIDEIAAKLSVSPRTVKREWKEAQTWLQHELYRGSGTSTQRSGKAA